jgi:drug/metabolite transporter (DMT)-like permease
MPTYETVFIFLLALICNALGSVLFKKGASQHQTPGHSNKLKSMLAFAGSMISNKFILCGLLLQLVAVMCWLAFLSRVALNFAFPLSGINNVTILLASYLLLNERIGLRRWAGVLVILVGVSLVAYG